MLRRLGVPALLVVLAAPLGVVPPAAAVTAASTRQAGEGDCSTTLLASEAIRTEAGGKLGTARIYVASRGDSRGFCVRITPIERLRSRDPHASLRWTLVGPDGEEQIWDMYVRLSWKAPFVLTDAARGSSLEVVARLRTSGGRKGTARLTGTLG